MEDVTREVRYAQAIAPVSLAVADTKYNGAAIGSAAGIDVSGQQRGVLVLNIGTVADDVLAVSVVTSALATNPTDAVAVSGASIDVVTADAGSQKVGYFDLQGVPAGHKYVYVKTVQSDTDAVLLSATIASGWGLQRPNENVAAFDHNA